MLGLALLAMAEPLGSQMAGRVLEHLLQVCQEVGAKPGKALQGGRLA